MAHKIIQWNCRGLRSNFNDLAILLQEHSPSAVCLQETNLKPNRGDGCHLRVVPPGQLHRRPSTPKRFINIVFFSRNYIWVWSILHYFSIYIKSVWR